MSQGGDILADELSTIVRAYHSFKRSGVQFSDIDDRFIENIERAIQDYRSSERDLLHRRGPDTSDPGEAWLG